MNFDLNQLLKGPVRDLVLEQITKKLGVSPDISGNLLTKGLSMIIGGFLSKTNNTDNLSHLFDLIKTTSFSNDLNPLDILVGKGNQNDESNLLDLGKTLLPRIFGTNTESVANYLGETTNTSSETAKGLLGMLLPIVFSFLKGKIATGLGLSGFAGVLATIGKLIAPYLDTGALKTLGFKGAFDDSLATVAKLAAPVATTATAKAASTSAVKTEKKSGMGKFILPAVLLLAALLGYKSCSSNTDKNSAPVTKATDAVKTVDGLGNLSWNKTDKDLTVSGTVQNDEIKAKILNAFKGLAAGLPLVDKLTVDPKADKFAFGDFTGLANLFGKFPNVSGSFADKLFNLTGSVENDADKAGLLNSVKGFLGDKFSINADGLKVTTPEISTPQAAVEAPMVEGLGNLSWNKTDKDFTVSGIVPNEETKANILNGFKGLSAGLPLVDNLTIDPKAGNFAFGDFAGLANLFAKFPNVNGAFNGNVFNLVGSVANDTEKAGLLDSLKAFFGDKFTLNADNLNVAITEATPAEAKKSPENPQAAEIPTVDGLGDLHWNKTEKGLIISGKVQNDEIKANILDAFKTIAADSPLIDNIGIDPKMGKFAFTDFTGLTNLFAKFPTVNGAFKDNIFNLVGEVESDVAKNALINSVKAFLGDKFTINADALQIVAPVEEIKDMSAANLDLQIVFPTGSSDISPRYFRRLDALAKYFIENNRRGEIAGYTDNVGNAESNKRLSEVRANAVRNYLISKGVPAEALVAVGYGQENPVADNNTVEGRNKNRRIEFKMAQ